MVSSGKPSMGILFTLSPYSLIGSKCFLFLCLTFCFLGSPALTSGLWAGARPWWRWQVTGGRGTCSPGSQTIRSGQSASTHPWDTPRASGGPCGHASSWDQSPSPQSWSIESGNDIYLKFPHLLVQVVFGACSPILTNKRPNAADVGTHTNVVVVWPKYPMMIISLRKFHEPCKTDVASSCCWKSSFWQITVNHLLSSEFFVWFCLSWTVLFSEEFFLWLKSCWTAANFRSRIKREDW